MNELSMLFNVTKISNPPDFQGRTAQSNKTGREERQTSLRPQLFPSSWLYLELWCFPPGKY